MGWFLTSRNKPAPPSDDLPPQKRISTPAGQRLSVIMENANNAAPAPQVLKDKRASAASNMSGTRTHIRSNSRRNVIIEEESSSGSSGGYSYASAWSDASGNEKLADGAAVSGSAEGTVQNNQHVAKRGRRKKLCLIISLVIAVIIVIVLGVVLGLQMKNNSGSSGGSSSSSQSSNGSSDDNSNDDSDSNSHQTSTSTGSGPSPTSPYSSASSTSVSSDFPAGNYSMVTFLDTTLTDCTSVSDTWSCYPYTEYNDSPSRSMATFNWIISASTDNDDDFVITSTDNPFAIDFQNEPLSRQDTGSDTEHFRFQITIDKSVQPSSPLSTGDDDSTAATCFYNSTTFQAYLYTKIPRGYPDDTVAATPDAPGNFEAWPFRVRVEEVASGGSDNPNCYGMQDGAVDFGNLIDNEAAGLEEQDPTDLCSCLYKNWRTP